MATQLDQTRVAFVVSNEGVERAELTEPWDAVEKAGGSCVLAAPKAGKVSLFEHVDRADTRIATMTTTELDAANFDAA